MIATNATATKVTAPATATATTATEGGGCVFAKIRKVDNVQNEVANLVGQKQIFVTIDGDSCPLGSQRFVSRLSDVSVVKAMSSLSR